MSPSMRNEYEEVGELCVLRGVGWGGSICFFF